LARAQLDVSTAGKIKLALNSVEGLKLWVDGTAVEPKSEALLDFKAGAHILTIAVDLDRRKDGLLYTLEEVPGSPARAQWLVGK
ncbi:hypothetical protein ACYOEI_27890, partial [Singulisphaera rosea]